VVRLLDGLALRERQRVVAVFRTPPLVLSLQAARRWCPPPPQAGRRRCSLPACVLRWAKRAPCAYAARRLADMPANKEHEGHRGPRMGMGGTGGMGMGAGMTPA
jgi:hypothetical protein